MNGTTWMVTLRRGRSSSPSCSCAENFAGWEIVADRDGWHAYPSARLALHCYLNGHDAPDLHRATAAGLLVLLEAWRDRTR